ncbi:hypothetical protein Pcinc_005092 [Petrolisthes cinctipes]|uniref:Major facilitator superfamily (MFS) profile domain-containing protein n=1 Tax=Petrolisthes cinctipes TaxID=88211 RepID=A0AAE1GE10_PETCI|nr:hypothetical protein Pcinc_005092 [Petrolisthes cinctipes]
MTPASQDEVTSLVNTPSYDLDGEFDWSETLQGLVLGSFSYGYIITQVVGGRLAERYGAKWVFGVSILSGGVANLLTPTAARLHYGVLIALRAMQGFFQGVTWPSMHACLAQWIPPLERPSFVAFVYFGTALGTAVTLPLCGLIIHTMGWAAAFYVTGSVSLIWCLMWFSAMHSKPAHHPRISREELQYIENAIRSSGTSSKGPPRIPWKNIATSLPVWAIIICDMGNTWGISLLSKQLPTFMKNILGFNITMNGFLSALPFLSRYLGGITISVLSRWILKHGYLSIINTRRVFSAISQLVPAVMLVGLIHTGCNSVAIVAIICIAFFFNGAVSSGHIINHHDIAPNFSGTLYGINNTLSSILTFIVPVVTGVLIDGQQTLGQWRKAFWICVPMYVVGELFFLFFLSGTVQPWNSSEPETPALTPLTTTVDTSEIIQNKHDNPNYKL